MVLNGSQRKTRSPGFVLIELMVVIAILAVIAAIAIPNLLRARASANESSAISSLRTLVSVQALFAETDADGNGVNDYARSLRELGAANLIDSALAGGEKSGYFFSLASNPGGSPDSWNVIADPAEPGTTGDRSFFVDETGDVKATGPCPPGQDCEQGERARSQSGASILDFTSRKLIGVLAALDDGEAARRATAYLRTPDGLRAILDEMDADGDAALSVDEVLELDVLGAARRIARTLPGSGRRGGADLGSDAILEALGESYLGWLRGRLKLGAGNERDAGLVAVELDELPASAAGELARWMNTAAGPGAPERSRVPVRRR